MSKDKKKKKKDKGDAKPKKSATPSATERLSALTHNPLVADVVAAALISMAAALKDSDKARSLADDAGDQLTAISKKGAKQGSVMWDLALDIGRRTLEALSEETVSASKRSKSAK